MVPQPDDLNAQNEEIYDQLISLIENTQGRLAPIIVACDDEALRKRIIQRYESEALREGIRSYRIVLGQEPSMRAGLESLAQQEPHLQRGGKAVFTVTGAEMLLRVKLNPQDEQSELDKFFGYLQWTREGLREFRYPIVLWVTYRISLELSRRSADFWSWRKAVLRFETESPQVIQSTAIESSPLRSIEDNSDTESLPPLVELQAEIAELTANDPNAPGLATLYDRLGQVYARRVRQGIAESLEQECERAIAAFQQAIARYQADNNQAAEMWAVWRLGNFFDSQSLYTEAIAQHQKSLDIARGIKDLHSEANSLIGLGNTYRELEQQQRAINFYQQSLNIFREIGSQHGQASSLSNLGGVYSSLGQDQRAINFYQESLKIFRRIGDRNGQGGTLCNLGNAYNSLGQYQRAVDLYQQALNFQRDVRNRDFESNSLGGLGSAYASLNQYQRAIDCYQQALMIQRKIGNRDSEAYSLINIAYALAKLDQPWEALQHYQQAKQIYQALGLEHKVEECDAAIYDLNQIIPVQQLTRAPRIDDTPLPERPSRNEMIPSRPPRSKRLLWVYGLMGVTIVLLIWWLKR